MKIEILGGKDEIGGNKILVEHKGTRIFLDFGMSFGQANKFYAEFLKPRKSVALKDFFEMKLLPKIEGVYRADYLKHMDMPEEERKIDALFLTHAHADHAQYIHFLREDIPIFCSKETNLILEVLETTGNDSFLDLVTVCKAFTFYPNRNEGLSKVDRRKTEYISTRKFVIMETEKRVKIGSLEIEMVPVDHSLPGCCGFIIYSDEGNLVYTGDIRFHGYNADKSKVFVKKAIEAKPKWMLCEGTRINKPEKDSEEAVKKEMDALISKAEGLVFVEHPIRDLDRVITIFNAAKESKRILVVTLKQAYLIKSLQEYCPFKLEEVKILLPQREWGIICKEGDHWDPIKKKFDPSKEYSTWERDFVNLDNSITYKELAQNPGKYVVSINLWEIGHLIDIKPAKAIWIKSTCEPFCEEMEIDEDRKKNWLQHFNVGYYEGSTHASGHASGEEIKEMIKQVKPEILIPIHTEHPKILDDFHKELTSKN